MLSKCQGHLYATIFKQINECTRCNLDRFTCDFKYTRLLSINREGTKQHLIHRSYNSLIVIVLYKVRHFRSIGVQRSSGNIKHKNVVYCIRNFFIELLILLFWNFIAFNSCHAPTFFKPFHKFSVQKLNIRIKQL